MEFVLKVEQFSNILYNRNAVGVDLCIKKL